MHSHSKFSSKPAVLKRKLNLQQWEEITKAEKEEKLSGFALYQDYMKGFMGQHKTSYTSEHFKIDLEEHYRILSKTLDDHPPTEPPKAKL